MSDYQPKVRLVEFLTDKDRILEKPCERVEAVTEEVEHLIEDMRATMHFYGGLAIAAPQVGKSLQVIVFNAVAFGTEEDVVMINPEIDILSTEKKMEMEFCLSFPDGKYVSRFTEAQMKGFNRKMEQAVLYAETPLQARVLQHEHDHLLGKTF